MIAAAEDRSTFESAVGCSLEPARLERGQDAQAAEHWQSAAVSNSLGCRDATDHSADLEDAG